MGGRAVACRLRFISVVFYFGCVLFRLCFISVVFYFGCVLFRLCFISVVFYFGCVLFLLGRAFTRVILTDEIKLLAHGRRSRHTIVIQASAAVLHAAR